MPENNTSDSSNHMPSKSRSQSKRNSSSDKHLRIENLTLENFKAFDSLTIEFPIPLMANDPDIVVMGSKNGLGKTSILEACSLLFLAANGENTLDNIFHPRTIDLWDILIRAGQKAAHIKGTFTVGDETVEIGLTLSGNRKIDTEGNITAFRSIIPRTKRPASEISYSAFKFFLSIAGLSSEPLLLPPFMYFHSYRKVQEGRLDLGAMVEEERFLPRSRFLERETTISTFKQIVLRSLMSRGSLFEDLDNKDAENILNTLNDLMKEYAGGRIEKLRPSVDSKVEFRVTPVNNPSISFNFDGLSSGQKEIISTLFLIWYHTRMQPGIILIDEPELHLNPEWHRSFFHQLYRLAPRNQYIVATHSEDIFSAVDKNQRILLAPDVEGIR